MAHRTTSKSATQARQRLLADLNKWQEGSSVEQMDIWMLEGVSNRRREPIPEARPAQETKLAREDHSDPHTHPRRVEQAYRPTPRMVQPAAPASSPQPVLNASPGLTLTERYEILYQTVRTYQDEWKLASVKHLPQSDRVIALLIPKSVAHAEDAIAAGMHTTVQISSKGELQVNWAQYYAPPAARPTAKTERGGLFSRLFQRR